MKVTNLREQETAEQTEERIVLARRNRMKLASFYINVNTIVFYDYVGSVERTGKVVSVTDRGLLLQYRGYRESFFFESLLELEIQGSIAIKS